MIVRPYLISRHALWRVLPHWRNRTLQIDEELRSPRAALLGERGGALRAASIGMSVATTRSAAGWRGRFEGIADVDADAELNRRLVEDVGYAAAVADLGLGHREAICLAPRSMTGLQLHAEYVVEEDAGPAFAWNRGRTRVAVHGAPSAVVGLDSRLPEEGGMCATNRVGGGEEMETHGQCSVRRSRHLILYRSTNSCFGGRDRPVSKSWRSSTQLYRLEYVVRSPLKITSLYFSKTVVRFNNSFDLIHYITC